MCDNSFTTENFKFVNYTMLTTEQLRVLLNGRNSPEVRKWMYNPEPISWEEHLNYVEFLKTRDDRIYWAIFYDNEIIGSECLNPYEPNTKVGVLGKFLFPEFQGKGLGGKFTYEFLDYVFSSGIANTIKAETKITNERNVKINKSIGFVEISRNKEYVQLTLTKDRFVNPFLKK